MTHQPETAAAVERIRTYLRLLPNARTLGGEIAYSEEFRSEDWPRSCYAPTREDVETLLAASSAGVAPATDQTALRERVAEAVKSVLPMSSSLAREVVADAVLSVLPASVDRADALASRIRALHQPTGCGCCSSCVHVSQYGPPRPPTPPRRTLCACPRRSAPAFPTAARTCAPSNLRRACTSAGCAADAPMRRPPPPRLLVGYGSRARPGRAATGRTTAGVAPEAASIAAATPTSGRPEPWPTTSPP